MTPLLDNIAARAATPLQWLIVLGMAYTLASTVLFLAAPPEFASVEPRQNAAAIAGRARPGVDLDGIVNANLFGVAHARDAQAEAAAASEATVETRLPLILHGVFVADKAAESTAIVARKGRSEQVYHIGDKVPGDATLDAVHLDHVVLRRGRVRERLAFPKSGESFATPNSAVESAAASGFDARLLLAAGGSSAAAQPLPRDREKQSPEEMAQKVRDKLQNDPGGALGELGLSPVSGGESTGYRLDRLAQSPYLRQTGLQPGDVILSINGQPVGDVERDRLELDNVLAQGSARIEVQRGDRRFFITASLK